MELAKRRPVYPLIWLLKALCYITWGLGRIRTIATPLDRRNATTSLGGLVVSEPQSHLLIGSKPHQSGAKESVVKQQLKHRHPLSTAHNVAWGFFAVEFRAWQPVKSLDYNGFHLPFAKFSLFS